MAGFEVLVERLKRSEMALAHEAESRKEAFAAHAREHALISEAMAEHRQALADQMDVLNHLRDDLLRLRSTYLSRDQFDLRVRGLERMDWFLFGGIAGITTLVQLLLRFWR